MILHKPRVKGLSRQQRHRVQKSSHYIAQKYQFIFTGNNLTRFKQDRQQCFKQLFGHPKVVLADNG